MISQTSQMSDLTWTDSADTAFRDAYLSWSETLRDQQASSQPGGVRFEPIFVRLTSEAARQGVITLLDQDPTPLRMDAHERGFLEERMVAGNPYSGMEECYALYRRFGTPDSQHADLFEVIDTGVPVTLNGAEAAAPETVLETSADADTPIVAVIDDAIGFLNARFRRGSSSRLHAIWLQALEHGIDAAGGVASGSVLGKAEIERLIALGDEDLAYGDVYARHLSRDASGGLWRSSWHGTHILDLAGGADEGEAAQDWPLLAVQLPPESIEDTTGMRLESYLVQGVRWILRSARKINPEAPVIVNLSLGILAGPKNGTQFAEWRVAEEARQWEQATGQKVRIVWAFGNAYRGGLVAGFGYEAAQGRSDPERSLTWRLPQDDHSPNFCEIRTHGAGSDALEISLTTPDGVASDFARIAPGESRSLMRGGDLVARMFHVPERRLSGDTTSPAYYVLATSPTDAHALDCPRVDAGAWEIGLRYDGDAELHVSLQIQRDDSLRGRPGQARQSYFDDATAYDWDMVWQEHAGLSPDGPIRHEGTHSAYASIADTQVITVGAARRDARVADPQTPENFIPSDYTAEGAEWAASGPSCAAPVDGGPYQTGVMAAGRVSGSVRFTNGTSAAAARVSRALAMSAAALRAGGGLPAAGASGSGVDVIAVRPQDAARLGTVIYDMPDTRAARR